MALHPAGLQEALADRYAVQRELGRGGMATVYLAEDLKHHRPVAIKVLNPELAATLGPERFVREIQFASQLSHPHILPLYDSGAAGGLLYYVMPYIEGESLRHRLDREKQLGLEEALAITQDVAAALTYAHNHGVIHRDIKPENILLAGGEAIVADFGIAKAISAAGGERLTNTGLAIGTVSYMSPEQALAEADLDGRTDVYSLGCVLFEMLVGQPPYTGATAQAVVARQMRDPVPSVRAIRERVPSGVEVAIGKSLARIPADRYSTAQAFAAALNTSTADAEVPTPVRERRAEVSSRVAWPRRALPAAVILLIALLGAVLWFRRPSAENPLDANLIAVAPFDVRGAELASWGEGMVDYLSRSLDGAGSLRTVSPSTFIGGWNGRADPASAEALGRRTGSGLVVFGSVSKSGGDSLRLRATMLDVAGGASVGEVEVQGDTLSIDRLADSLAVGLLTQLGRTRPVGAVRNAPLGGVLLPAIKEFLRGEQMYRRRDWDSSLVHYARAVALDTTFALAYRRMALVLSWDPPSSTSFEPSEAYIARAAAFNRGLPPRDSLLIAAEWLDHRIDVEPDSIFSLTARQLATTREAVRRFPGDPEVWLELGEFQYHRRVGKNLPPHEILASFDRAIALDSGFAPSFEHVFQLAFQTGNVDRARAYSRAYAGIVSNDVHSPELRLVTAMLDSAGADSAAIVSMLERASTLTLFRTGMEHVAGWADSSEWSITVLKSLASGRHPATGPPWVTDSLMWPKLLIRALLFRGHVQQAYQVYRPLMEQPDVHVAWGGQGDPLIELGFLGIIPADTVSAILKQNWRTSQFMTVKALEWWLSQRDTLSLSRFVHETSEERAPMTSVASEANKYLGGAASAYLTLIRGDSAGALRAIAALPDSMCLVLVCTYFNLTHAQILVSQGEDRKAAAILDRDRWTATFFHVIATLERGQIAERLGERELAVESYQRVVDLWRRADPSLQPYVGQARDGLARLTGEP
jgi:eukaryotic-like serine/threonine-protein kinase